MSQVKEIFKQRLSEMGDKALKDIKYYGVGYEDIKSGYESLGLECPIMILKSRGTYESGWGNGYVRVPEGHEYYGKHYDEIGLGVHGGLTFSEVIEENDSYSWPAGHWIGFDTAHFGDNKQNWTKENVLKETIQLFFQL